MLLASTQQVDFLPDELLTTSDTPIQVSESFTGLDIIWVSVMNLFIGIGFAIALVALGIAILGYVQSGGSPESRKKANNAILWALIGMCIIIVASSIRTALINTLGLESVDIPSPPPYLDPDNSGPQ